MFQKLSLLIVWMSMFGSLPAAASIYSDCMKDAEETYEMATADAKEEFESELLLCQQNTNSSSLTECSELSTARFQNLLKLARRDRMFLKKSCIEPN